MVQPDLFWVSDDNAQCQIGEDGYWHGPPDFVADVLSPGTARLDKVEKFRLYQAHGVREYWIINPTDPYVEVFVLKGGEFHLLGVYGSDEAFTSPLFGEPPVQLSTLFGTEATPEKPSEANA